MATAKVKLIPDEYKKPVILGGSALAFFILGWIMAVEPGMAKLKDIDRMRGELVKKAEIAKELENFRKQIKESDDLLFKEEDRHTILGKLTTLTHESGLEVLSMEPSEKAEESFIRIIVEFRVSANFKSLVRFLKKLEQMKPSLAVTQLRMQKSRQDLRRSNRQYPLEANLTLEGLMRKK